MNSLQSILVRVCTIIGIFFVSVSQAAVIPVSFDVPSLWTPLPNAGYLNFVEPGPVLGPGNVPLGIAGVTSGTEEYTGWVDTPAGGALTGASVDVIPGNPMETSFDNGATHGDRVDFDFVIENRHTEEESSGNPPQLLSLHPGIAGLMSWEIAATLPSSHIDPAGPFPHFHSNLVPPCPDSSSFVCVSDYANLGLTTFNTVDVFSAIATSSEFVGYDLYGLISDTESSARDAALDYIVAFCNAFTGQCAPGTPVTVFAPGWTTLASADNYVARWRSPFPATHVGIDPPANPDLERFGVNNIVQIDAIVAATVPEPSTLALFCVGLMGSILIAWNARSTARNRWVENSPGSAQ
ncbi:hypothetical protein MTYP_02992 [Methylophilaceae bacterium]|nr:hypothetical protein MTYP_02992 [Methylophilaceae bacterium]